MIFVDGPTEPGQHFWRAFPAWKTHNGYKTNIENPTDPEYGQPTPYTDSLRLWDLNIVATRWTHVWNKCLLKVKRKAHFVTDSPLSEQRKPLSRQFFLLLVSRTHASSVSCIANPLFPFCTQFPDSLLGRSAYSLSAKRQPSASYEPYLLPPSQAHVLSLMAESKLHSSVTVL